ncbi:MAG: AAA family ATPase [Deltaproteobacteria bacterium]|nr:AAA family ATPase [Deltaproteobacteria bacterium]
MYCAYFGFQEKPFNVTPDPRFLYLSKSHEEVLDSLLYGINDRKGFLLLTGEVGTGKTTIARALLDRLGETVDTALLFNPLLSTVELLRSINGDFGQLLASPSPKDQIDSLNNFLLSRFHEGRNAVVIIDEAQNLSVEALEMTRLLSNLESGSEKLLQILLVGQPELQEKLSRHDLRQLNQRIIIRSHLKPLDFEDVCSYILFRLGRVGANVAKISFETEAFKRIYQFSQGFPRLINTLCDRILLSAYVEETGTVTERLVQVAEQDLSSASPESSSWKRWVRWVTHRRVTHPWTGFSLRGR